MDLHSEFTARDGYRLLMKLLAVEAIFVVVYATESLAGSPSATLHALFNLDGEATIPAWFSSMQLAAIGAVLLFKWKRLEAGHPARLCLALLGAGFIYLSMDESAAIHEKITVMLARVSWLPRFHTNRGIWISIYAVAGACALVVIRRGLVSLWLRARHELMSMAAGAVVMVTAGVACEIVNYGSPTESLWYKIGTTIEEFGEMAGASMILCAVLRLSPEKLTEALPRAAQLPEPIEAPLR